MAKMICHVCHKPISENQPNRVVLLSHSPTPQGRGPWVELNFCDMDCTRDYVNAEAQAMPGPGDTQ